MTGVVLIGDQGAATRQLRNCFHNRILNPVPWRLSKKDKEANPADFQSEYQEAYRNWPFQPPRDPLKPKAASVETNVATDMQTLYRRDFVAHPMKGNRFQKGGRKPKKEEYMIPPPNRRVTTYKNDYTPQSFSPTNSFRPNLVYVPPAVRFKGRSEYQTAYPEYEAAIAQICRPTLVKPVEGIDVKKDSEGINVSTCQDDYQVHSNVERPKPIIQQENQIQPDGPFEGVTMYMANYTKKPQPPPAKAKVRDSPQKKKPPFVAVSTFMADYKHHKDVKREASCRPPEAKVTVTDVPFSAETTVSSTYKAWPTNSKETPNWAKKAEYRSPPGRLLLNTTYMMDFKKPSNEKPPTPKMPNGAGEAILKHSHGNSPSGEGTTTYRESYAGWENARPATPYIVKGGYDTPKEKMLFESTQRSHYKGQQTKRSEICRHVSEHRRLNRDKSMSFSTTYQDTYTQDGTIRPKSSPSALKSAATNLRFTRGKSAETPTSSLNVSHDSGIDVGPSSPK